ncbi:flagellar hook-length control protein FliK [Aeromonas simiae]|uniref:flagellar hook-length control protein FliK n=1 Tax=Aeromonas simiae TaxID=218936 RepID=UPI00266D6502|nr:flagellar hook-length control protein FliK [Aeromonas simiae]MDO2947277.1 flagellar hook-length control protein FliK [Aeromonas simiae]MDO2950836.1 flagellar hook-length control protein FliK [Aeromonas simiae]MDO2954767.1 flagellar hook-length control protein FliK [Aeromonas simiae]
MTAPSPLTLSAGASEPLQGARPAKSGAPEESFALWLSPDSAEQGDVPVSEKEVGKEASAQEKQGDALPEGGEELPLDLLSRLEASLHTCTQLVMAAPSTGQGEQEALPLDEGDLVTARPMAAAAPVKRDVADAVQGAALAAVGQAKGAVSSAPLPDVEVRPAPDGDSSHDEGGIALSRLQAAGMEVVDAQPEPVETPRLPGADKTAITTPQTMQQTMQQTMAQAPLKQSEPGAVVSPNQMQDAHLFTAAPPATDAAFSPEAPAQDEGAPHLAQQTDPRVTQQRVAASDNATVLAVEVSEPEPAAAQASGAKAQRPEETKGHTATMLGATTLGDTRPQPASAVHSSPKEAGTPPGEQAGTANQMKQEPVAGAAPRAPQEGAAPVTHERRAIHRSEPAQESPAKEAVAEAKASSWAASLQGSGAHQEQKSREAAPVSQEQALARAASLQPAQATMGGERSLGGPGAHEHQPDEMLKVREGERRAEGPLAARQEPQPAAVQSEAAPQSAVQHGSAQHGVLTQSAEGAQGQSAAVQGERRDTLLGSQRLQGEQVPAELQQKVNVMLTERLQQAELQLDPMGLGKMKIQIQLGQEQQVSVHFVVQHGQTRDLVEQSMPRLRDMLAGQGITLGQTQVQQQFQHAGQQAQAGAGQGGGQGRSHPQGEATTAAQPQPAATRLPRESANGRGIDFYA